MLYLPAPVSLALYQHGILGQRWGIRRSPEQLARGRTQSPDAEEKKSVKDMSNEEIRKRIDRLKMEKEYKQLSSELNPKHIDRGKKFVEASLKKVVAPAAEEIGKQVVKSIAAKELNKRAPFNDKSYRIYTNNEKKK